MSSKCTTKPCNIFLGDTESSEKLPRVHAVSFLERKSNRQLSHNMFHSLPYQGSAPSDAQSSCLTLAPWPVHLSLTKLRVNFHPGHYCGNEPEIPQPHQSICFRRSNAMCTSGFVCFTVERWRFSVPDRNSVQGMTQGGNWNKEGAQRAA